MKKLKPAIALFLVLIANPGVKGHEAQKNVEAIEFDGNQPDPRCPCYKYQKRAEREYQRLLLKEARPSIHSGTRAKKRCMSKRLLLLSLHNRKKATKKRMSYRESHVSRCAQ